MTETVLSVVGVAIALFGLDALDLALERLGVDLPFPDGTSAMLESDLLKWCLAGVVVAWVLVVEGKPLSSIGVEPMAPLAFVAWVGGGTVATFAAAALVQHLYERVGLSTPAGFIDDQLERSIPARTLTVATAAVTESILYQAYPIERLAVLLGSRPAAGAVALLAFVGAHYVGDTFSLAETAFIGVPALALTVLYVLTGNLFVVVAVHAIADGVSLLGPTVEAALGGSGGSPEG